MNKLLYIIPFFAILNNAYSQISLDSLIHSVDLKVDSNAYQTSYLPDSLQQYGCEALIYFNTTGLQKLETGCGDASLEMDREYFYYQQNELVYVIAKRYYFNASPTFTKEKAKKEGVTGGWFDPAKTRVVQYECFFKNGQMIKMIDNEGNKIPPNTDAFMKTEAVMLGTAQNGMNHYKKVRAK